MVAAEISAKQRFKCEALCITDEGTLEQVSPAPWDDFSLATLHRYPFVLDSARKL